MFVRQVIPGLWRIWFPAANANAYLLRHDGELVLVDSGTPRSLARLRAAASAFAPGRPVAVVVTHYHWDHIGNLFALATAGVGVVAHAGDASQIRSGAPKPPGRPAGTVARLVIKVSTPFATDPRTPVEVDQVVADGDEVPVAGGLRVVHLPGHTGGHMALHWTPRDVLFAGDAVRHEVGLGPPMTYEDRDAARRSIARLAAMEFDVCVFGHGRPIIGEASRVMRPGLERLAG